MFSTNTQAKTGMSQVNRNDDPNEAQVNNKNETHPYGIFKRVRKEVGKHVYNDSSPSKYKSCKNNRNIRPSSGPNAQPNIVNQSSNLKYKSGHPGGKFMNDAPEYSSCYQNKNDFDIHQIPRSDELAKTQDDFSKKFLRGVRICRRPVRSSNAPALKAGGRSPGNYFTQKGHPVSVYSSIERKLDPWFGQTIKEVIAEVEEFPGFEKFQKPPHPSQRAACINLVVYEKTRSSPSMAVTEQFRADQMASLDDEKKSSLNKTDNRKLDEELEQKIRKYKTKISQKRTNSHSNYIKKGQPMPIGANLVDNYETVACREASLIAHFTLAHFGIESSVDSGTKDSGYRHVVVNVPSARMCIDPIQNRIRPYGSKSDFHAKYINWAVRQQLCQPRQKAGSNRKPAQN